MSPQLEVFFVKPFLHGLFWVQVSPHFLWAPLLHTPSELPNKALLVYTKVPLLFE
jgi:hypothetical protein